MKSNTADSASAENGQAPNRLTHHQAGHRRRIAIVARRKNRIHHRHRHGALDDQHAARHTFQPQSPGQCHAHQQPHADTQQGEVQRQAQFLHLEIGQRYAEGEQHQRNRDGPGRFQAAHQEKRQFDLENIAQRRQRHGIDHRRARHFAPIAAPGINRLADGEIAE